MLIFSEVPDCRQLITVLPCDVMSVGPSIQRQILRCFETVSNIDPFADTAAGMLHPLTFILPRQRHLRHEALVISFSIARFASGDRSRFRPLREYSGTRC